jgi:tetratricopeptide (TPR) repeat protein
MERLARIIGDNEMLSIALTYEGDMLQRGGNVLEALTYLEEARNIPASTGARGNAIQLLGRAYFKAQRLSDFERAIKDSEALAFDPGLSANGVKGQFSAGTVYEEYARSLGLLGQLNTAIDYLDKAEKAFAQQWIKQRRDMLIKTTKAMILVHGGEIREGVEVAVEATELCRQAGNIRLLDRIYGVQKHLDRLSREIGHSGSILREALDGPVEY